MYWFFRRVIWFAPDRLSRRPRWDRVYCRRCGQQFDTYMTNFAPPAQNREWLEAMGSVHDERCRCHRIVKRGFM